ncbi:ABC transporter permease [Rhizobium sp. KVB221]|uniref:ABC transporter permease n=1 Tax=Rhizobium setariae TaxID=2801340 RepID=A0A936YMK1_9HYPH|nr:ABC transporter permease [Rhizobium setariae]MBL0370976.1 ABC transporter permease [Rhizobium setariae]
MATTENDMRRMSAGSDALRGAATNLRVIVALIFREAAMRFGSSPFSYVWTLVEPAILISLLLFARIYIKNVNPAFGESSILFLLTGIVALRATRNIINKGGRAIMSNSALFDFGAVKPPDVVIARTTVEFTIWVLILACFFTAVSRIMGQEVITDFQGFVISLLLIFYFCIAMAMFNATVGALVPIWRSIWKMMSMPLVITSGILFVPAQMPPEILNIIIWNPFLHCVEALRSHSYLDYLSVYDPEYLLGFTTVVFLFSLSIERLFRNEIIRSKADDDDEDEI